MKILLSKEAKKQLKQIPTHSFRKYLYWVDLIKTIGLFESRRFKGFHDEPLRGKRSVRLSKSYRVIYHEVIPGSYEVIEILEVNKHDY